MHGMVALVFVQLLSTLSYMETLFLSANKLWYAHIAFIDVHVHVCAGESP